MLSITVSYYPECHYGKCRFAQCRDALNLVPIKKVYLIGCCWQLLSSKRFRFWIFFFQKKNKKTKILAAFWSSDLGRATRWRKRWRAYARTDASVLSAVAARVKILFFFGATPVRQTATTVLELVQLPPCLFFYPWRGFVVDIKARGNTKVQAQSGNRIRPIRSTYFRCSVKMRLLLPVRNSFSGSISGPGTVFTRLRTLCSLQLGPKC